MNKLLPESEVNLSLRGAMRRHGKWRCHDTRRHHNGSQTEATVQQQHVMQRNFEQCAPGYKSRGPGFDSRRYQILCVAVGLERGPLSLVRINEELLEKKVAAPV
jgi:hypothetical protein